MPRTRRVRTAPQAIEFPRDAESLHAAREAIEVLPVPVFVKDVAGRFLTVNRAWEEFFGVRRDAFIGRTVFDLYTDNLPVAKKHDEMDRELLRCRGSQSYELPVTARGGELRDAIYYKATFDGPDGRVAGVIGAIVDITERKRAEAALGESEARFRQVFELAASGIARVTLDGKFMQVNPSLCRILGYSEAELLGRSVKSISHPEDRDVTDAGRAKIHRGEAERAHFEKRYLRKDGSVVWMDLMIAVGRAPDGRPLYEISVMDDITARKEAEARLRAAHDELTRSNAELEQFAYVASHDLQEPLRIISSYTQLLQRRYGDRFEGAAKEFMDFIVDGAARMKRLIEDLLAYSRVGTRGKEFEPVDAGEALRRALVNLRAAIEEAGAAITYDALPTVTADDGQLAQLFQNLIGNALKFRSASVPRIHVSAREDKDHWEFAVRDNGIGIDPQYFERIFMVFQRLHNKDEYPGTGIGLAICKKVVDRHGGRIWVESEPGKGTAFRFTLPKLTEKTDV